MTYVIGVCGFVGAWFLVAGPIWQAAIELNEQELDREGMTAIQAAIPKPSNISRWWWLVPPLAYFLNNWRMRGYRRQFMDALRPDQLEQSVAFFNKANAWIVVAIGGALLATKETWELSELLHLPLWAFIVAIVVCAFLCVFYTVVRMTSTARMLHRQKPARRDRSGTSAEDFRP